jgi:putative FmdB family regulatory protein
MPIYEYLCDCCQCVVSSYQRSAASYPPSCPRCGGVGLKRLFSTFAVQRTARDVYQHILSDRELTRGMMKDDPRALAEWSKRMGGGEKSAPEYEELTARMERGEWPAGQIEAARRQVLAQGDDSPGTG